MNVFKHSWRAPGYRLSLDHFQTVKRMLAPDWAQKMLCIIVPNRRTASPEFFSWVRTRLSAILLLSLHTCPVRSPMLCVQGELSFLLYLNFPTRNERTTDESEKRFWSYQQEHFNLHWENSVFWPTTITRTWTAWQGKTTSCTSITCINCTFLCRHCTTTTWKCLISRFVEDANKQRQNFFLFLNLDMVERNSAPEESVCIWQSKRVGIITIETEKTQINFSSDVFEAVRHRGISKLPNI